MTALSTHFTLEELTASPTAAAHGLANFPSEAVLHNLRRLVVLLEDVRALLGEPMHISSGYRCPALNALVGGASTSAHMDGRAADFKPDTLELRAAFDMIAASAIPFDQLIIEKTAAGAAWIHVGIAREGETPRLQAMAASGASAGTMTYTRVAEG